MSVWDDIEATTEVRRDRWGRYLVVPPEGGKATGYTRATTIAKTLDDTSSLMAWGERMTAIGLSQRPDLLAEVALAGDDKKRLNAICTRAKEHGGATVRRDLGTSLHKVLEESFTIADYAAPVQFAADVAAVHQALKEAGLTVVPGMTERVVVNDEHRIAGTFDLLLTNGTDTFIADIKTGSSVAYGALGFSVQLAIYASADALYVQGAAADGSEDRREAMPTVDEHRAVIIHVEPGSGVCTLHWLDIAMGADALVTALDVRSMRNIKNILTPIEVSAGAPQPAEGVAVEPASAPAAPLPLADPARRAWIINRITDVRDLDTEAMSELVRLWPADIPTMKVSSHHTDAQLDAIAAVLDRVESRFDLPFPAADPATPPQTSTPAPPLSVVTGSESVTIDEGPEVPDSDVDALRRRLLALDPVYQSLIGSWSAEANDAGRPVSLRQLPSRRRWSIARAMIFLAPLEDDDVVRACIACVIPDAAQPAVPVGAALSALTVDEAHRLAEIAKAITAGSLSLAFSDDGRPVITGDLTAVLAA